jgi:cupin 2 domain-containing protein
MKNLFADIPSEIPEERFDTLLQADSLHIQRIVSRGHASPDGFWYDQQQDEWVVVMQGAAVLQFEDQAKPVEMGPGDWLNIPAGRRHRVAWTDPDRPTIWLAVHYQR